MTIKKKLDDPTIEELRAAAQAEITASLDAYQADLEAALVGGPPKKRDNLPDLTPPDDVSDPPGKTR